jgi:hypothetical protein
MEDGAWRIRCPSRYRRKSFLTAAAGRTGGQHLIDEPGQQFAMDQDLSAAGVK